MNYSTGKKKLLGGPIRMIDMKVARSANAVLIDQAGLNCTILQESCKIPLKTMHLFKRSCEILAR